LRLRRGRSKPQCDADAEERGLDAAFLLSRRGASVCGAARYLVRISAFRPNLPLQRWPTSVRETHGEYLFHSTLDYRKSLRDVRSPSAEP